MLLVKGFPKTMVNIFLVGESSDFMLKVLGSSSSQVKDDSDSNFTLSLKPSAAVMLFSVNLTQS